MLNTSSSQQIFLSSNAEETFQIAQDLAESISLGTIIALRGDLGAGKTTFSKGLISKLTGVDPEHIQSPTFIYLNQYESPKGLLCHFDLYRLTSANSFEEMGFLDYLDRDHICLIEWPEILTSILPEQTMHVTITYLSQTSREILIERNTK